jgi:hypothetical protein
MNPRSAGFHLLKGVLVASLLTAAGPVSTGVAAVTPLPTVTITLSPSSISVGGTLQSGAVQIVSTATGGREPSPGLVLLKPGVNPAELYGLLNSNKVGEDPNLISRYGSIVFDPAAAAGKSSEAQTVLQPGQYVAVDAEGEKSSTWPRTSFTVTPAGMPAMLPAAQATVRSIDFAFRGPSTLHDGELVRFENEGFVVHMDLALPVKSPAAAKKLIRALQGGNEKQVGREIAGEPVNFAGPLSTGGFQQETITASPGWYVQVCFMETQDGRNHALLGMERAIRIVR